MQILNISHRIWGLAAIYSYRAYQEQPFMDSAIEVWEMFNPWAITTDDATAGAHPMKTMHFRSQCNNSGKLEVRHIYLKYYMTHMLPCSSGWWCVSD